MSRAFVKEDAAAPEPPLPERPVSAAPNRVTARGARLIRQAVADLKEALTRNPTDDDAAALLRRDLRYWQSRLASMHQVTTDPASDVVGFGCRVTIRRGSTTSVVTIVGEDEADPSAGLIAWTAPLARAIDGGEVNDVVELDAAGRRDTITVVAIAAGD
jgi:transcription elongation GreA/GreB family factor